MILNEIEKAKNKICKIKTLIKIMEEIKQYEYSDIFSYFLYDETLRITIAELKDLSRARNMFKKILGKWKDNLNSQFISDETFITVWRSDFLIEIWYKCHIDNIDEKLKGKNCKIEKKSFLEYRYICDS